MRYPVTLPFRKWERMFHARYCDNDKCRVISFETHEPITIAEIKCPACHWAGTPVSEYQPNGKPA